MDAKAFHSAICLLDSLVLDAPVKSRAERKLMNALDYVNETGRCQRPRGK